MHEARLCLYRLQRLPVPLFIVSEFHAAVYNLSRERPIPYLDALFVWFRARTTAYLANVTVATHPRTRYLELEQQWTMFGRHMHPYYVAFRSIRYPVRREAERMFKTTFGLLGEESVPDTIARRTVEQQQLTHRFLQIVSHTKKIPGDVWSLVASFLHPLYVPPL